MSQLRYILPAMCFFLFISGSSIFIRGLRSARYANQETIILESGTPVSKMTAVLTPQQSDAVDYIRGKFLFTENCQACHNFLKTDQDFFITGIKNQFWDSTDKIAAFLREPQRFAGEAYIQQLMKKFGQTMPHIPVREISNEETRMICSYVMIESEKLRY
jgi:mono/diheme cytochrome c family protein